jgi:hypothetical protein
VRTPFSTVFMHDRIGTPVNWALSAVGRACLAHCPDKEPASWVATRENGVGSQSVGLEAVGVIAQFPIGRLCLKAQGFITGKWRNAVATMRACLFGESFGRVFVSRLSGQQRGERSAIDLAEYDVERADDRRDIGKHVPSAQEVHRLQMGE